MGATWVTWRATMAVIFTVLQNQDLISAKTPVLTGVEGGSFDFRCDYADIRQDNAKYFRRIDGNESSSHLIHTKKHNQWEREGRFSLYDNTTGAYFTVRMDNLILDDSGMYCCGVDVSPLDHITCINLSVAKGSVIRAVPLHPAVEKLNMTLFLTAAMCVVAMLFVCLFSLSLLLAVKQRRSSARYNREVSSDYETMMPGVGTEPKLRCSCSALDCTDFSALSPPSLPPPNFCPHNTSKHRQSAVSLGLSDYVDVDVPGHICPYQHLDLGKLEEHVYHSLHVNSGPKNGMDKVQNNCQSDKINLS